MKHSAKIDPFLRLFVFVAVLVIIAVAAAIGLFYYMFGIPEPEGRSLASWPHQFTENFSAWMKTQDGELEIEEIALNRLDEYGLWLQVLDETGREVTSYNKPPRVPAHYSASQLAALSTSAYGNGHTVFVSSFEDAGQTWSYLIGFPYAIGKHMLYYNGENVSRLSPIFRMGIGFAAVLSLFFILAYGFWLTRHLGKITKGISAISQRTYLSLPEKGMFREIYKELDKMDHEIQASDQARKDTERSRREWIANITHDLKTPLSPVKGYGELLASGSVSDQETAREYGEIILKNADHAENLINDLKLTYQLESGAVPYHPEKTRFLRYLRELVIDIANDPAFRDRNIQFESHTAEITASIDPGLFRRAVGNLVINALTHNPPGTKITVIVKATPGNGPQVIVRDQGKGLSSEEQAALFNRYYRGTSTKEKPEGSGLGLAIAKQIANLHGGDISVKSKPDQGTEFTISLPL